MPILRPIQFLATSAALALGFQGLSVLTPPHAIALLSPFDVTAAAAESGKNIAYKPPVKLTRAIRTGGTGSRGCDQLSHVSIMPLVPSNHIGQTLSKRPTFLAHVAGAKSVEFTLIEPKVAKPLAVTTVQPDEQGLVRVELPDTTPELAVGKEYRWSIAVICNPNRRSNDVFAQSWIQRVAPNADFQEQLAQAPSDVERARLYAASGLWYDAIATLTQAHQANPNNATIRDDLSALLRQANLNNLGLNVPNASPAVTSQTP